MAVIGVLREAETGHFALTPVGELLKSDAPGDWRGNIIRLGEVNYQVWASLLHTVQTGETAFDHVFGMGMFDHYAQHPEYAHSFSQYMVRRTSESAAAITAAYDFSPFQTVVDVGGGYGTLLATILQAKPQLRGILFDLSHVLDRARPLLEAAGVASRCELVAGSFFERVPEGGDAYLLKWIVHDWDDEQALRILMNCHQAMGRTARLLLVEALLPERATDAPEVINLDLTMLVVQKGRERTEAEYRSLLSAAGFSVLAVHPTQQTLRITESVPL